MNTGIVPGMLYFYNVVLVLTTSYPVVCHPSTILCLNLLLPVFSSPFPSRHHGDRISYYSFVTVAAAILLQAVSPWLLSFTPLMRCQLASCFPLSSINSATMFLTSRWTCSWGEITETETRPRPTVRVPRLTLISDPYSPKLNVDQGIPSDSSHPLSPSPCLCPSLAGMSVEMVAMLLASAIQGQVVAVYNTEKQEACQHLDQAHETSQSTSSPHTASLQETVDTALKMLNKSGPSSWVNAHISLAAQQHYFGFVLT